MNIKFNNQNYNNVSYITIPKADNSGVIKYSESPSGSLNIIEDGEYDVLNVASINVNIPIIPTITVYSNGTVTASIGNKSSTHILSSTDDPDFIPANIKNGINIFGQTGTLVSGLSFSKTQSTQFTGTGAYSYTFDIPLSTTLTKVPFFIMVWQDNFSATDNQYHAIAYCQFSLTDMAASLPYNGKSLSGKSVNASAVLADTASVTLVIDSNKLTLTTPSNRMFKSGATYKVFIIEAL